ncbi:hypothetical protein [Lewinella sp. 4G2]|uniref:hypothetical protein n=1 Tax=Lewinella sp. 4G2 TaxID=1803372 RepID=UPI0012F93047|nr:hypothetical protein [Lewinella sp. 4G2]
MRFLSFLFLALLVTACGETESMKDAANDNMAAASEMVDTEAAAAKAEGANLLQSTIQAVQSAGGDITALSPDVATSNIESWMGKLKGVEGADGVVSGLSNLKNELTAGSIDGSKVSGILSGLATEVRGMSGEMPALNTLASALDAGAKKLGGM